MSAARSGSGASVFTVLLVVFVVLKLTGLVAWSWWWVTAPVWLPAGLAVALLIAAAVLAAIGDWSKS